MKHRNIGYVLVIVMAGLLSLWGCPKKTEVATAPEALDQKEAVTSPATPSAETSPAASNQEIKSEEPKESARADSEGLKTVFFDYDQAFIRDDQKIVLKHDAEWLKAHPGVKVKIEGNCDERGTREYNQALGQRRSATAKNYLVGLGVSPSRISLISYGKEKPVCTDGTEQCMQKNRRDDFEAVGG